MTIRAKSTRMSILSDRMLALVWFAPDEVVNSMVMDP